ncbi:hypothetical protein WICPIJ_007229 [Wickerhamomyces pijperi]|uniref:Uncharacterized protein n=1 Tax=Wickerhamomyces pijperi TaxID=599730 RepID=A0A9P8Q203_WICPI|nr:hypothetical protein WICPIJ_007229 [Wickerhamomyces pijperi]
MSIALEEKEDVELQHIHSNSQTKSTHSWLKRTLYTGSIVLVLIWGSGFLIHAIKSLTLQSQENELLRLKLRELQEVLTIQDEPLSTNTVDFSKRIGFDQVRNSSFFPEFKYIQWIHEANSTEDKGLYAINDHDKFSIKSIQDDSFEKLLFNGTGFTFNDSTEYKINQFVSSPDLNFALLQTNHTQHWRHSSFGLYWILDVASQEITPLRSELLSIAVWSPTSQGIAYVLDNNVWVFDVNSKEHTQASFDGGKDIFNGKPDWVYEEEVLEGDTALWWSPNGEHVAYLKSNDSLVPEFPITYFIQGDEQSKEYPELRQIKYPKPGYANPVVRLALFSLTDAESKVIEYTDDVFTEVVWVGNDELLLKTINREADFLKVVLVDAEDSSYEIVRDEQTDSWFEISHDTYYVPKSDTLAEEGYIDTVSFEGFNHLAYFSPPSNSTPQILTSGEWEVVDAPSAYDHSKDLVYFFSTEISSIERHLYSVSLVTGEKTKITPADASEIEQQPGVKGAWFTASFSTGSRYVSLNYRGPGIPYQILLDLYTGEQKELANNSKLAELLSQYEIPTKNYGEIEISEGVVVNFVERLPPNFDPTSKYPVLFYVYGGPGSQLVTKTHSISFPEIVCSQLDAIVVTVDGRGTGFKGREFRSLVRDNLGTYETIDQIAAAKTWGKRPYIDEKRMSIFGWSYGGYMTLKTLERDAGETFQYGMSVAPVTDWRLYDSVYTERYMHTPESNAEGYAQSAVHNVTAIGQATRFFLVHGSGDDNVHFQNSAKLLDQFNLEGVLSFDMAVFPDSDHSISYHNANHIIYDRLLGWLKRAFRGDYVRVDY